MTSKKPLARSETTTSSSSSASGPATAAVPSRPAQPLQFNTGNGTKSTPSVRKDDLNGSSSSSSFVVVTSGLETSEKSRAKRTVKELGGRFLDAVDDTCTHLVVRKVGTQKYLQAVERSIPIVSFEFIQSCEAENRVVDFREYQCGPFLGLVISATGTFANLSREELNKIVEKNGGRYDGTMMMNSTTHLVVGEGDSTSEKVVAARDWNIKLVTLKWIQACVEQGAWKPESGFQPELVNVGGKPVAVARERSSSPAVEAIKRSRSIEDFRPRDPSPPLLDADFEEERRVWSALEGKTALKCLRRCFVFIDCKHDERWKVLRNLARFCGATVLWDYSAIVTHVVVARSAVVDQAALGRTSSLPAAPDPYANIVRNYLQKNPMIFSIQPKFLVECADKDEWLDEKRFMCRTEARRPLANKRVCVSGYTGSLRSEVSRLCQELGAEYTERLDARATDILVCNNSSSEKYKAAIAHNIPIHDVEWLRRLVNSGGGDD